MSGRTAEEAKTTETEMVWAREKEREGTRVEKSNGPGSGGEKTKGKTNEKVEGSRGERHERMES